MQVSATVKNAGQAHAVALSTNGACQTLDIAAKASGKGSSINGGELLLLALATCYCNDLYREAERMGIVLTGVEIEATAEFPGIGLAARNIQYRASVASPASQEMIAELVKHTDAVAEVHNTVRAGVPVVLASWREGSAL